MVHGCKAQSYSRLRCAQYHCQPGEAAGSLLEERSGTLKLAAVGVLPYLPSAQPTRQHSKSLGAKHAWCWRRHHTAALLADCGTPALAHNRGIPCTLRSIPEEGSKSKRGAGAHTTQPPEPTRPACGLPVRHGPPAAAHVRLVLCLPRPDLHLAALVHQPVEKRQRPWLRHHAPDALRHPCTAEPGRDDSCSPGDWPPQAWRCAKQELFTAVRVPAPF